jgi:hypothetical protein
MSRKRSHEARKIPAEGDVFFLTSTFIELISPNLVGEENGDAGVGVLAGSRRLLWQADAAEQVFETRVRAQAVEQRINL